MMGVLCVIWYKYILLIKKYMCSFFLEGGGGGIGGEFILNFRFEFVIIGKLYYLVC